MQWEDDSLEIPFGHIKDAQTRDNSIGKFPSHCYCNNLNYASSPISAIFDFMAMNPNVVTNAEE